MSFLAQPLGRMAVSLGVGLVIGAERERRMGEGAAPVPAGIRTFGLVAVLGGASIALESQPLLVVGAVAVAALALVAYLTGARSDRGLTTAFALLVTYFLGALAGRDPFLALACALCTATLLAFRATLHSAIRSVLSEHELRDALLLGVAAVVILPILPDRAVDPFGVVYPFRLWRLVVAFMSLSALGHVAQRAIGPRYGLALAGFGSGFVSSAATIASMGTRSRADKALLGPTVAGAAASSVATLIQLAILVGAADPRLLRTLGWPLAAGGVVALAYAALQTWRVEAGQVEAERGHAFKVSTAFAFAALVSVVSVISTLAVRAGGQAGLLATAALAGLADTHSAAAAVASVSGAGQIPIAVAELGVLFALTTNTVTKCVLAVTSGGGRFAAKVIVGLVLIMGATWGTYAVVALR